ncbi:MAG: PLP-dependent aminotransferase family protein [Gemmatimonadota bacterium]|jgi:GntR family transcriptional regulator/MocR family aminotransferase
MRRSDGLIPLIHLRRNGTPLYEQLYDALRGAIVEGRLPPETRLPSTRSLAEDLDLARMTVIRAYRLLQAEGYVESMVGAGTWVADELPDRLLRAPSGEPSHSGGATMAPAAREPLSSRGRELVERASQIERGEEPRPFLPGVPAGDELPREAWREEESAVEAKARRLRKTDPAGELALRRAIASLISGTRGGRIDPDRVVITSSAQESFHLLAELLLDRDDAVLFEDPGYREARKVLEQVCEVVSVEVDEEGMRIDEGAEAHPRARLAYVTPSNQFPLGHTMSMARREALLAWASRRDAYVMEDDHDGWYRYEGRPLPSLLSMDEHDRVVYVGTFNKLLGPLLRLGFAILPTPLVKPFLALRSLRLRHPDVLPQLTLARFIEDGQLVRYIRKLRQVHRDRRDGLVCALRRSLDGRMELSTPHAGTHVLLWLPDGRSAAEAVRRADEVGVTALALSQLAERTRRRDALVLGFGGFDEKTLDEAATRLVDALG